MSDMKDKVVCWILVNCSFYHIARWSAFSRLVPGHSYVLELSENDIGMKELTARVQTRFHRNSIYGNYIPSDTTRLSLMRKVFFALDEIEPDIVFVNGWAHSISLASYLWAIVNNKSIVLFTESNKHDFNRTMMREFIKRIYLRYIDAAVCGGSLSRKYLVELGVNESNIFAGYNAVDNSHFNAYLNSYNVGRPKWIKDIVADKKYFLSVGRLEEKKNHLTLIKAFSLFKNSESEAFSKKLIIAGAGELMSSLQQLVRSEGLENDVYLIGGVHYDKLPELYSNAHCFIHPSYTEQWGLVVNEAMASGLSVLVSNRCGCVPELVHDGVNGFTFDSLDPCDILDSLKKLSQLTDDERRSFGAESLKIIQNYAPSKFGDSCLQAALLSIENHKKPALSRIFTWPVKTILSICLRSTFYVYGLFHEKSR